jgi:hypothetical protein
MLDDINKILFNTKSSILDDYSHYYKTISKLNGSERLELKKLIINDINKYESFLNSNSLLSSVEVCLRFQYISLCKYNFPDAMTISSRGEKLDKLKNRLKNLVVGSTIHNNEDYSKSSLIDKEINFAITNEESFIKTFTAYSIKHLKGNNPYLVYDFLSYYVGFYSPYSSFEDWRKDCIKAFEGWIDANLNSINYENKKWFPSKKTIADYLERNKYLKDDLIPYINDVKKIHDEIRDGLKFLSDLRELTLKRSDWSAAIETIDAINNGISAKHFLLEKAHDMKF